MPPRERPVRIAVPGGATVSAVRTAPNRDAGWTFVYAPGAGSRLDDPFGVCACRALAERGVASLRFQFPYMEAGRRGPDRPPLLEATWRAALDAVAGDGTKVVAAGRSMGGRVASMVIAAGAKADALALFAYPLHPPGKPHQLRTEHLPSLKLRTLFCSGTNDAFAAPEELRAAAAVVRRSTVHLLEGADHGFGVPKRTGRTREDIFEEATESLLRWLRIR